MPTLVWYHIEEDIIFENPGVDCRFFGLHPLKWDKLILLGEL